MPMLTRSGLLALILSALSAPAVAAPGVLRESDYRDQHARIDAIHREAMAYCAVLSGNTRDVCVAEADGKQRVARAELEAAHRPSAARTHAASVATLESQFTADMKRCDGREEDERPSCRERVRAERLTAQAGADITLEQTGPKAGEVRRQTRPRSSQPVAKRP